jgi:hypothetical protein
VTSSGVYRDTVNGSGKVFKGAAAELMVCVHLMRQGYYVYRAESPHGPFDLVAYRDGVTLRVEVKSMNWSLTNRERGYGPSVTWPTNDEWDLLVVVDHESQVCHEITTRDRSVAVCDIRRFCGYPAPTGPLTLPMTKLDFPLGD